MKKNLQKTIGIAFILLCMSSASAQTGVTGALANDPCEVTTFPFTENFETSSWQCWQAISMNVVNGLDGTGTSRQGVFPVSGKSKMFEFCSAYTADDYSQYLISPKLPESNGLQVYLEYIGLATFQETFKVGYSLNSNNPADFTWGSEIAFTKFHFNNSLLSYNNTFPAGTKYVAIYYYKNPAVANTQGILIDNISISGVIPAAPTITATTPANNATNIALDAEVSVTFNRNVRANNLTGITINGQAVAATVSENKLTMTHPDFEYETTCNIVVPANTVDNYAEPITWSFTTIKHVEPRTVLTKTPADNATNVAINAEVSVTFDGNITANDLTGITINGNTVSATVSGNKLTMTHADFEYGTTYNIVVPTNAVADYAEAITWSFTTVENVSEPLAVVAKTPANGATAVTVNAEVSVTFNKNITANGLTGITINGDSATASISGNKLMIAHADFVCNPPTTYTVIIPADAIVDYDSVITWSFVTVDCGSGGIDVFGKDEFLLYPNPSSGKLTIHNGQSVIDNVEIYDISGKKQNHASLTTCHEIGEAVMDIAHLPAGIYLVRIESNGKNSTHKLVISR